MDDIIFEIVKIVVMVAALVVTRYMVPWLKEKIGADNLAVAEKWVKHAVLMAQQVMWNESGEDKKGYVTNFIKLLMEQGAVSLTDEQLDILIEAAVKQMKIDESAGAAAEAGGALEEEN